MRKKSRKIGVVLSSAPGYSETFIKSLLEGLTENENYSVLLFAENHHKLKIKRVKIIEPFKINRQFPKLQTLKALLVLGWLILVKNKEVFRFIKTEKNEKIKKIEIIKKLYLNAHIILNKVDWLHYGFGNLVLDNENIAYALGAKLSASFRGSDINVYPLRHQKSYLKFFSKADKIQYNSHDLLKNLVAHGFTKEIPHQLIYPAIKFEDFFCNKTNVCINKNKIKILTVGRLHWIKGIPYAFEAIALLNKSDYTFEYSLIGEGEDYEHLIFLAKQLKISDQIIFIGKSETKDVSSYLKKNDLYLQPSLAEGFSNACLEAQASGLLCIVSDAEGMHENIVDGKTGFVVPKRDPIQMALAIEKAIYLPEKEHIEMIRFSQERIRNNFNIKEQQKKWIEFFSDKN